MRYLHYFQFTLTELACLTDFNSLAFSKIRLDWITNTISTLNYWEIVLLMLLKNIFPPISSEVIMPLAGFMVTLGKLNFVGVIVAGTIGSILGAFP